MAFALVPSSWEPSTTKSAARKRRGREENLVQLCMVVSTLFLDVFLPGAGLGGAVAAEKTPTTPGVGEGLPKGRSPTQGLRGGMVGRPPLLLSRRASRGGREGDGDLVPGGRRRLNPEKGASHPRETRLGRLRAGNQQSWIRSRVHAAFCRGRNSTQICSEARTDWPGERRLTVRCLGIQAAFHLPLAGPGHPDSRQMKGLGRKIGALGLLRLGVPSSRPPFRSFARPRQPPPLLAFCPFCFYSFTGGVLFSSAPRSLRVTGRGS